MPVRRLPRALLALLLLPVVGLAAEVTIYRCTDDRGRLTLRDSPCLKGERQEARTMVRPQDPPPRAASPKASTPAAGAPGATITRTIVVAPQRQTWECFAPDGSTYLSDTGQGEPRWQSALPYAYSHHLRPHRRLDHGGLPPVARPRTLDGRVSSRLVFDNVGRPTPKPPRDGPGAPSLPPIAVHDGYYASGAWVHDHCQPLPQGEVCARLRDRRHELGRRYNSALQSERTQIVREQRGIDARLSAECGR